MKLPIYLDNHATTPLDPRVLEAMMPSLTTAFGNAASTNHSFGTDAAALVEQGRKQVADLIGAAPKEIVLTSGATESDNLAIKGVARMYRDKGDHIITVATEHKAVLDSCKALRKEGYRITYLPVDSQGILDLDDLRKAIDEKTILISVMFANNEIGVIQPIREIGEIAKRHGVLFHTDAVQALGKVPINVDEVGIDLLSISGHKMYGPKGVGALYVRGKDPRVRLEPILHGGGHERGMRSGTLNVPGIVGLGEACEISRREMAAESERIAAFRDRLWEGIQAELDEVYLNGHPTKRHPGNLNVSFSYVEGESMILGMRDIAVSTGSACTSATLEPSHVLKALGIREDLAHTSIRFGLGRFTSAEEIDFTLERVVETVKRLRAFSPLYSMAKKGVDLSRVEWKGH